MLAETAASMRTTGAGRKRLSVGPEAYSHRMGPHAVTNLPANRLIADPGCEYVTIFDVPEALRVLQAAAQR
jgi:hypothetical protein